MKILLKEKKENKKEKNIVMRGWKGIFTFDQMGKLVF